MALLITYIICTVFFALNLTLDWLKGQEKVIVPFILSFLLYCIIWPFWAMRQCWLVWHRCMAKVDP